MIVHDRIRLIDAAKIPRKGDFLHDIISKNMPDLRSYFANAETSARWSVYALFALAPLFFVPLSWISVPQSKIFLVAIVVTVAFLAWIAHSLNSGSFRFPKSPLLIAAALIPLAYIASAFATGFSLEAFAGDGRGQDTVVGFMLLYLAFLVSAEVLGRSSVLPALQSLFAGATTIALIQLVHLFAPSFTFGGVLTLPATSVVGSWHDLGIFLALIVFISLSLWRTSALVGYWKPLALCAGILSFALLLLVNLSDVWAGLLVASIFWILWQYRSAGAVIFSSVRAIAPWIALALISAAMFFGGNALQEALPPQLQVVQIEVRPSWQGTFAVGREVFAEPTQIFFGSGPNTFSREWGVHKPLSVNETQFWNTDFYYGVGFIPTSLLSTGIAGLLAWGAVSLALLWALYRLFREPSKTTTLGAALIGSALFLTAFHILYVPGPALGLLTFLIFGAFVAERIFAGEVQECVFSVKWEEWKGKIGTVLLVVSALIVFLSSVQTVRVLLSDVFVNRAVATYAETGDATKATHSLSRALAVSSKNDRAHRAGVELGMLRLSELASQGSLDANAQTQLQTTLAAVIQHGLSAVSIESDDYQNWLTLARLYGELAGAGIEGAEKSAREAYKEAKVNNPSSPLPYVGEAQLDLLGGKDEAARMNLELALEKKPNLAAAHFLLSQIYARANDFAKAREYARFAVEAAPNDPLGWYNAGTILYAEENYSEAAYAFEQAIALQNNYANAYFLLGISYQRLGRDEDALKSFKTVDALNPGNSEIKELIATIEKSGSSTSTPE